MIAATTNSETLDSRSQSQTPLISPGIPCHPDERLLSYRESGIAGGLTEPDESKGRRAAGNAATPEPSGNPGSASGSVSPLVSDLLGSLLERAARARV